MITALALIAFLSLAVMSLISSETRASRGVADMANLRMLQTLPEKLVISQIRRATSELAYDNGYTWTSQPGMIRIFDTTVGTSDNPTNGPSEFVKLYSSDQMNLPRGSDPLAEAESALASWEQSPAVWTDLNQPLVASARRGAGSTAAMRDERLVYPIFDPGALTRADTTRRDLEIGAIRSGGAMPQIKPGTNPMPVRWLYVLKDGQVVAPAQSTGYVINLPLANRNNPVVGRIAFWTDDESAKLNLNTATVPAPWTRPVSSSRADLSAAYSIPAFGEHYRESAHPAFTSLRPVLDYFGRREGTPFQRVDVFEPVNPGQTGGNWWSQLRDMHLLLPSTTNWATYGNAGTQGGTTPPGQEALASQQRWFANVDEFFFTPTEGMLGNRSRNVSPGIADMTQRDIELSRFLLTTRSRSPELNPFGLPKVSLWPVQASPSERHQIDRKMALAASLSTGGGRAPYYFQNGDSWDSDSAPGSSQSATFDSAFERNVELFNYLRNVSDRLIPGSGDSFGNKYGIQSRNHLLASMLDMIRWGINPASPESQQLGASTRLDREYRQLGPSSGNRAQSGRAAFSAMGSRWTVPQGEGEEIQTGSGIISVVKGYGRFPVLCEIAVVIVATEGMNIPGAPAGPLLPLVTKMRAFVVVEPYNVAPGTAPTNSAYKLWMEANKDLEVTITPPGVGTSALPPIPFKFPNITTATSAGVALEVLHPSSNPVPVHNANGVPTGGEAQLGGEHSAFGGFWAQFLDQSGAAKTLGGTADQLLVFASQEVSLTPGSPTPPIPVGATMQITPWQIAVEVRSLLDELSQRYDVLIEDAVGNCPAPVMTTQAQSIGGNSNENFEYRFRPRELTSPGRPRSAFVPFLRMGDVVRSVEAVVDTGRPGVGDIRHLAARVQIPQLNPPPNTPPTLLMRPSIKLVQDEELNRALPPTAAGAAPLNFQVHSLRSGNLTVEGQLGMTNPAVPVPELGRPTSHLADLDPATPKALTDPVQVGHVVRSTTYPVVAGTSAQTLTLTTLNPSVPAINPGAVALNYDGRPGDYDNGPGIIEDGPYIGMPEWGNGYNQQMVTTNSNYGGYFQRGGLFAEENGLTYSPLRQMGSAVGFGSLPSGIFGAGPDFSDPSMPRQWQTLLFCPHPPARTTNYPAEPVYDLTNAAQRDHFGFASPRDHLWAEFFFMPAVEPAGFCDNWATEGKVNMNYQIMPFSWIKRRSAMHGALEGVRITAIPTASAVADNSTHYKHFDPATGQGSSWDFQYAVNAEPTLQQFERKFANNQVFITASEICDILLVPKSLGGDRTYGDSRPLPTTPDGVIEWWEGSQENPSDAFEATGDNTREAPYAQLYPRLCTRSNVFKVHYRVQALQKVSSTSPSGWDETRDRIAGEYRGEAVIERYLDPDRTGIIDFATNQNTDKTLDDYYDYRVLGRKQFAP
ncbi:MAG: Verru_Chthon cassette protein A [Verrucomicrobiaceae bacterium]|nr:Verru_Chthon cassette protein A [Verrucomicrobiaceae bacterium]